MYYVEQKNSIYKVITMNNYISLPSPTFKRQKFLLAFIKSAGGTLSYMDFQKLLFLYLQRTNDSCYEFVPYLYGCYSFQAAQDIETLSAMGWLDKKDESIRLLDPRVPSWTNNFFLESFQDEYKNTRGNALVRRVYRDFPYFAINSKIAGELMNGDEFAVIRQKKASLKKDVAVVFTIGYEGLSLEKYLNTLIQNDVHVLCDVRSNPISRKFGFSKDILSHAVTKIGVDYVHVPELGIVSDKRKHLSANADYDSLFGEYAQQLPAKKNFVDALFSIYMDKKRIALTCFEHDPAHCHRHVLSDYMAAKYRVKVAHL